MLIRFPGPRSRSCRRLRPCFRRPSRSRYRSVQEGSLTEQKEDVTQHHDGWCAQKDQQTKRGSRWQAEWSQAVLREQLQTRRVHEVEAVSEHPDEGQWPPCKRPADHTAAVRGREDQQTHREQTNEVVPE